MVLRNYIELEPGKAAILHFRNHQFLDKTIRDPLTGQPKPITTLVFDVDWLNNEPATAQFSVTSEKLARQLEPYLAGNRYRDIQFIITKIGSGFATEHEMMTMPWTGPKSPEL